MIYVLAVLIIIANIVSSYVLYKLLSNKPDEPKAVPVAEEKKENQNPDDAATNAERLYMEGIQAVLSYDADVMKKYLKEGGND